MSAQLREFYVNTADHGESLFETWERGDARGDSVTPSTYSEDYRRWMCQLLTGQLRDRPGGMVSIGCGNAAVEAEVARAGHRVLAVDVIPEAVEIARSKGIEAVRADAHTWSPPAGDWTLVYADGIMCHLYDPEEGLQPVLTAMHSWLAPRRGVLVISNDRPRDITDVQAAPGVPDCYWLSDGYLRKQTEVAGFQTLSSTIFRYQRPLSGPRERAVLTATV